MDNRDIIISLIATVLVVKIQGGKIKKKLQETFEKKKKEKQSRGQTVNRCEAMSHSGCRLDDVSHYAC